MNSWQMERIFRQGRIIMKKFDCVLCNGIGVETENTEYLNVYITEEAQYSVSIGDWDDLKLIHFIKKLAELPAEQVIASFVYDDLTECGIEEGLHEAKNRKIGWVVKEDGDPIQSLKELCMWVLSSRFFEEVPSTIIESVDIEEFGIHLLEGNTIFLYDDDKKRVRTHTGQYYTHNNLILYHLGM